MKSGDVTPLILTFNEEANIRATLCAVSWARQIVIVDSGSTDETLRIAGEFPQVVVYYRAFDHFAEQCNFGLRHIETPWTLSLDADYRCPSELADEIAGLDDAIGGYRAAFRYAIFGRPLRNTLYPPRVVLYRTQSSTYVRDGHAHRVKVAGAISELRTRIVHDDRKPIAVWFHAQLRYSQLEADKLLASSTGSLGWKDRLRRWVLPAPILTLFYCLFLKRLILDGRAGMYYTLQRVLAELILSLTLLDRYLRVSAFDMTVPEQERASEKLVS